MTKWYYETNGSQQGPVTQEALQSLLAGGTLQGSSLAWAEGMADWKPIAQIPALQVIATGSPAPVYSSNPYAPPPSALAGAVNYAALGGLSRFPFVKRTNYVLMAALIIFGGLVMCIGIGVVAFFSEKPESQPAMALGIGAALVGCIIAGAGWIMSMIYLYRAWLVLQPHTSYATPGKAVGFLFIPFFNLYWQFVAYWRWTQEWNRLVSNTSEGIQKRAPRASEGLFLTYAILQIVAIVLGAFASLPAIIIYLIMMHQVCAAVNYAADNQA